MPTNEAEAQESDARTDEQIKLYDTGGGYLIFSVGMEYHSMFEQWFPVRSTLIGFGEVEDWDAIRESLAELNLDPSFTEELYELHVEDEEIMNR